ncbi:MAG: LPS export ABC transporter periplasmic protein LptC [Candidatus Omnitrophica bacterium]|nr:LPS export ABC transporter periplasmic protein LptC [Candidatus Omnitrophota bacterium]MDD5670299.1 LPS export ABC transporter periplasmic protein LptC [Candidatus Omnitrophota bacterium]
MIKRIIFVSLLFILLYTFFVQVQVLLERRHRGAGQREGESGEAKHKVYFFSFTKYTSDGEKEIEIEGDSANILSRTVELMNVVAKAYASETPVTITADEGSYDKVENKVHLKKNVVATTEDGARLLTEKLDIHPETKLLETQEQAEVKKDNINIEGKGAQGDSRLKQVRFNKNVTVVVQDTEKQMQTPTVITCDGPLNIDYDKNIAYFKDNVVAEDERGKLNADAMDVYYNKESRRVSKIICRGNVVIENPDGNKTYSDNVVYLAEEGRIILGGDTEALYQGQGKNKEKFDGQLF